MLLICVYYILCISVAVENVPLYSVHMTNSGKCVLIIVYNCMETTLPQELALITF